MAQTVLNTVTKWKKPQRRSTRMGKGKQRRRPLLRRLMHSLQSVQLRRRRKQWRQKSRRQRKTGIQKKQKWRLRSLPCYLFAALSYQPGQHRVVELVLSVSLERNFFLFAPMLSHCTGVLKHSGPAYFFFFMKCYLLVFKMSFFFSYLYKSGHATRSIVFQFPEV